MKRDYETLNLVLGFMRDAEKATVLTPPQIEAGLKTAGKNVFYTVIEFYLRLALDKGLAAQVGAGWRLTWGGHDYLEELERVAQER